MQQPDLFFTNIVYTDVDTGTEVTMLSDRSDGKGMVTNGKSVK